MRLSASYVPPVRHIIRYITWRSRQSMGRLSDQCIECGTMPYDCGFGPCSDFPIKYFLRELVPLCIWLIQILDEDGSRKRKRIPRI
ncbi:hypothetical protein TNCT_448131 [Trichonephila clavata]|uniref:Uncharacterized protein n=1 Tax=Trichonephila clavata TaxID=2740835 RepID=A0A8X6J375_TRICU|nr:hypothetical protein TNCT_448131 [Trichonephila clavata]